MLFVLYDVPTVPVEYRTYKQLNYTTIYVDIFAED